jgi:hypothetical protein
MVDKRKWDPTPKKRRTNVRRKRNRPEKETPV